MEKLNHTQDKQPLSFQINQKPLSDTEFHFICKDKLFGFEWQANLVIKCAPLFLIDILDVGEDVLICRNVKMNSESIYPDLFEIFFVKLVSEALGELYRFGLSHQLPGALILLPQSEWEPLTELQKHWLKDFLDLFGFVELSPRGVYQLYMPITSKSFQHYCELHALLEQSIFPHRQGQLIETPH